MFSSTVIMTCLMLIKWMFLLFTLLYGIYVAYEDLKDKEIHAYLIFLVNIFFVPVCLAIQGRNDAHNMCFAAITLLVSRIVFLVFEKLHWWGSGDTKMAMQGLLLAFAFLCPQTGFAMVFMVVSYMFISTILGLIIALIKRDKNPPMAPAFLCTNIICVCLYLVI